jgi:hypothetical protein
MKVVTNPVEALVHTGTQLTQALEELEELRRQNWHYVQCLDYISKMPNEASPIAIKGLQLRPFRL